MNNRKIPINSSFFSPFNELKQNKQAEICRQLDKLSKISSNSPAGNLYSVNLRVLAKRESEIIVELTNRYAR